MKKTITILAMLALSAATAFAQMTFGAGYAHNIASTVVGDSKPANAQTDGFYVEGGLQAQLGEILTFSPSLRYTFLASGETNAYTIPVVGTLTGTSSLQEHYISIPAMFELNLELDNGRFFMFAGPTANFGLASTAKISASAGSGIASSILDALGIGSKANTALDLYKDETYNRFDVMLGGGVGFQFGNIILKAGYNYGMIDRNKLANTQLHNQQIYFGISYAM